MNYYKLIKNASFIGVATDNNFRFFQSQPPLILLSGPDKGHYIDIGDGHLYRSNWMNAVATNKYPYESVEVVAIEKEEYDILKKAEENPEENFINVPSVEENFISEIQEDLEYFKDIKIQEMSIDCYKAIIEGFDIVLSDNKQHHFSLEVQDQLNLTRAELLIREGNTSKIPYHADGEEYCFYSTLDMNAIIIKAEETKLYNTVYFNSLKIYIKSLENVDDIMNIYYGVEIPLEYQSDVLKSLIKG